MGIIHVMSHAIPLEIEQHFNIKISECWSNSYNDASSSTSYQYPSSRLSIFKRYLNNNNNKLSHLTS